MTNREPKHAERRNYPLRCTCGYQASSRQDLDEHIIELARAE